MSDAASVVAFWRQAGPQRWFAKDAAFDADFRTRFLDLHYKAARRECDDWMNSADGALGLLLLLDQFPRNCFRGSAHMYATDPLARYFAKQAITVALDKRIAPDLRLFLYLPLSHSEDLADQEWAVELGRTLGDEPLAHAIGHRDIIKRFGRFPHRNAMLGRIATAEEQAFLDAGGFAG